MFFWGKILAKKATVWPHYTYCHYSSLFPGLHLLDADKIVKNKCLGGKTACTKSKVHKKLHKLAQVWNFKNWYKLYSAGFEI